MEECKPVEWRDGSSGKLDRRHLDTWTSPGGQGLLHRTPDGRWIIERDGCSCIELDEVPAASVLLGWGWMLPPRLARAVAQGRVGGDEAPRQRLALPPALATPTVVLCGPQASPIVLGVEVPALTRAQYDVVEVLVDAGPPGLSLTEMRRKSQHGDARKILNRVRQAGRQWRAVVQMAGAPYQRYRIAVPA